MRGDWTACGARTSGSTAPPGGAMRRAFGGVATTSTPRAEPSHGCFPTSFATSLPRRLGAAVRRQRGSDGPLVRVDVVDARDADARRLDDVDGVDADVRTDVARRRGVVPRNVGGDDGSDDAAILGANAVALSSGRRQDRREAP